MKKVIFFLLVGLMFVVPRQSFAGDHSFSVGIGSGINIDNPKREYLNEMLIVDHKTVVLPTFVFVVEPTIYGFSGSQIGIGVGTFFRNYFPLGYKVSLFVSWGAGAMISNKKLTGESLLFNFTPQGGAGLEVGNWTFECRYWHASNAGFRNPNSGVDNIMSLISYSF
ncbi:acyloxyacyl hydrolase [Patescibacteria group bacterium]|nr:acyloxyacyl hydrolase [Patescibacteria group bacterium]MCL5733362.1 acyloxyacyl hydrolase [Patescibacteria group bacterium]